VCGGGKRHLRLVSGIMIVHQGLFCDSDALVPNRMAYRYGLEKMVGARPLLVSPWRCNVLALGEIKNLWSDDGDIDYGPSARI